MIDTAQPPPRLAGAEIVPGYEVVAHLSRGHLLDVYDAWSTVRHTRCVVKVIRPDRRDDHECRSRLLDEGRLLHDLAHPHLVRAYEVVTDPDPAVVLETLTGPSVADVLDDRGRLGIEDVALLGAQVASALHYLHRHGWVHCDVTGGNVVVEGTQAKLIDLSLARPPGAGTRGMGTRGYRAPEQVTGDPVSAATDVWGLGALLLEASCGRLPGEAARRGRWPLRRPWEPPAALEPVISGCLHGDPHRRWSLPRLSAALERLVPLR